MTTDFFKHIAALGTPGNWKITIATTDNINFVVSAQFTAPHGSDHATALIPPMLFKNTAEKLDEVFFRDITEPVKETAGLFNNMEAYHKAVEQARLKSKEEQDKKKAQNPATPKKETPAETEQQKQEKEDMKRYYEEAMMVVAGYIPQMKYAEALEALPTVEDYPNKKAELTAKREELEKLVKLKEKSLFAFNNG